MRSTEGRKGATFRAVTSITVSLCEAAGQNTVAAGKAEIQKSNEYMPLDFNISPSFSAVSFNALLMMTLVY